MRPVIVLGGKGDGVSVAEAIRDIEAAGAGLSLYGYLDDGVPVGTPSYGGKTILGRLDDWRRFPAEIGFVAAIQKVKDMPRRIARIESLGIPDERWVTVRHPFSVVAEDVDLGTGAFIASFASVHAGARVGRHASVRSAAVLGHDSAIADHAYVGPNGTVCGRARLERGACLGPNAVLLEEKAMGEFSIAGIGAVVTKDVPAYHIVFGVPAIRVGFQRRL